MSAAVEAETRPEFLLGPRSVTWHLHADPAMWVAGITSLFLQALHPRAAAGVLQNSTFRTDQIGRLLRTSAFVGTSTYRPLPKVQRAAAKVRGIHRKLRAVDPVTGAEFRVDDPELLLWVHCAEVFSFLTVLRRAGFPITAEQADRYLDEQRRTAELVGLSAADVPGSVAAMREYFHQVRPSLAHTEESEVFYRFLIQPPIPLPLRFGYLPIGQLSFALLPRWATRLHEHQPLPAPVATAGVRAFRQAALLVPQWVRWRYPHGFVYQAIQLLGPEATPSTRTLATL